jgi:hypothetical protein
VPLKGIVPGGHDDHGMDMGGHSTHTHAGPHAHNTQSWGDTIFGPKSGWPTAPAIMCM